MRKKIVFVIGLIFFVSVHGFAQNAFLAVASGNWNASGVWSLDGVTPIVCGPCVAGTDFPGANDQAYTQGFSISLPSSTNFSVSDLYVAYNVANGLTRPNLGVACTLTIKGELASYDPVAFDYATPTTAVIKNNSANLILVFDGANAGGPVISSWGTSAPLRVVRFSPSLSSTTLSIPGIVLSDLGQLTVTNGTLQLNGTLQAATATATVTINSGTILQVNTGNINGNGTSNSLFPTIIVNGTLTSQANSSSYINCSSMTMGAGSSLNVGYNGANQTQGWWYQGNSPVASFDPTSTVTYNASAVQNISAGVVTYGNLSLTSGSTVTKSLSGTGLTIQGNLTVGANVTFSPSSQVDFTGTAAQSISGTGALNFNGGIEINKSSGTVTFNKAVSSSGITITSGTLNLGDVTTTLSNATVSNAGTITSGTAGSLLASGTNTFSGAGTVTLNNLTVSSGSTNFNNSVTFTGNLTNSGSLSFTSSATATFSGGNSQTISGNAFTLGNMVVNKASQTLTNNGNIELTGVLTMTTGTFDADGSGSGTLTLNSDTNGDAAIGVMAGGSITGEVTFERYFNNTSNRWRNLAFPVSSVTYAELGSSITLNTNSLGTYTESTLGDVDQGWNIISGGTLNSALGHSAWMYNIQPITISVRGPLLQNQPALAGSPYNFNVSYTNDPAQPATQDGWNFIPNPFPSPIDWDNAGWTKTNVNASAAIWDVENNVYQYSSVGWDGVIAQGQAFWVQTNAASPSLRCTETVKVTNSNPTFYRIAGEEINSRLLISLKSSKYTDKAVVQFREGSTSEFDGDFDAYKLKNPIFNLSTLTHEGVALAANNLPKSLCNSSIKLNVTNIEPGSYTFNFEGLETFANLNKVTLIDSFLKETNVVDPNTGFAFEVTSDSKSFGSERFQLVFDFADQKVSPVIERKEKHLVSSYETGNQWYFNNEPITGATGKVFTPSQHGTYYVVVNDGQCDMRSDLITVEEGFKRVFPNPTSSVLKVDVQYLVSDHNTGEILLHSMQGQLIKTEGFTSQDGIKEIPVSGLTPGAYILTITTGNGIVLEKTKVILK